MADHPPSPSAQAPTGVTAATDGAPSATAAVFRPVVAPSAGPADPPVDPAQPAGTAKPAGSGSPAATAVPAGTAATAVAPGTAGPAGTAGLVGPARPAGAGRRKGAPGLGSIFVLAYIVILVPGVLVYILLRLAGLAIGPAGLLGLLMCFLCLGLYPTVLRRLKWVPPRRKRR